MPTEWNINPQKPDRLGPNPPGLVGCKIRKNPNATAYMFEGPHGTVHSISPGTALPTGHFRFPVFRAQLSGAATNDWYLTVETMRTGAFGNEAWGYWSNTGYIEGGREDPTDTWVAEAGAGAGEDEEGESSAASASSNPY
jgi:hypothetical protein